MTTQIKLNDLEFYAYHGYYEVERKTGNQFIINVDLQIKSFDEVSDDINDTIDYQDIYNICKDVMSTPEKLLETVLFKIIQRFKADFQSMEKGSISIKKIQAQLGGPLDSAEIVMNF